MKSFGRWSLLMGLLSTACGTTRSSGDCPNWKAAMRGAQKIAACDASFRGNPKSRCQLALKRCKGGCDVCQFLRDEGLDAYAADKDEWPPIERVPFSRNEPNGLKGTRAQQMGGLFGRRYKFNWYLCHDDALVSVLAQTIVHEAMHECIAVNPPGILDLKFEPPPGCSAAELENACVGK